MLRQLPFQKPCLEPGQPGHQVFLPKSSDWVPAKAVLHSGGASLSSGARSLVGGTVRNGKELKQDQAESCT